MNNYLNKDDLWIVFKYVHEIGFVEKSVRMKIHLI